MKISDDATRFRSVSITFETIEEVVRLHNLLQEGVTEPSGTLFELKKAIVEIVDRETGSAEKIQKLRRDKKP